MFSFLVGSIATFLEWNVVSPRSEPSLPIGRRNASLSLEIRMLRQRRNDDALGPCSLSLLSPSYLPYTSNIFGDGEDMVNGC
jgi:hypothetical protein